LAGVAILLRMDFLIVCPMLAVLAWHHGRSLPLPALVALGVCTVLLAGLGLGVLNLQEILAVHRASTEEMRMRAHQAGWDLYTKAWVSTAILHPLGFALVGVGVPALAFSAWRRDRLVALAFGAASLPLLFPATSLLSVKYLLPLMAFLPMALVRAVELLEDRLPAPLARFTDPALMAAAVLALLVSIEPDNHAPFLRVSFTDARQIGTHDGARSFGAYLRQALEVQRWSEPEPHQVAAKELLAFVAQTAQSNVVLAGSDTYFTPGAIGWRHTQLLAEQNGFHGTVLDKQLLRLDVGSQQLWLTDDPERALAAMAPEQRAAALVLDLRDDAVIDTDAKALALVHNVLTARSAAGAVPR
jgi:hypothetical protein